MSNIDDDYSEAKIYISCSTEDKIYAEVGRNWTELSELANKYGFKMNSIVFSKGDSEIRMTIEQLQSPRCIGLLRTAMVGMRGADTMTGKKERDDSGDS